MKCCNCPALVNVGYEYPDEYCELGVSDDELIEFKDGEYGCKRRSFAKIKRDLGKSYVEWDKSITDDSNAKDDFDLLDEKDGDHHAK